MWKTIKSMLVTCCAALCLAATVEALTAPGSYAQGGGNASLKGIVKDAVGPVVGASVILKGSTSGTTTSADGMFTLPNVKDGDVIVVSFIGYQTQEIPYAGQTELNVTLQEEATALNAVVVTALGIKRSEKALSYSVQQVKSDELTTVKSTNFMNSLVGKVAGAQINASSTGAGGAAKVVLRGAKSITKDNNALYVIDGIPMNNISFGATDGKFSTQAGSDGVADINPEDIENISVLSGPSAAALYGTDAANGVVMITTKKGVAGKTTLSVSNSTMFSSPFMMPKFQNTYGNKPGEFMSWGDKTDRRFDPSCFFNTGSEFTNSINFSTGSDKHQLFASASSSNNKDILPNSEYDRYNFSMRTTSKFLNDKFTIDLGANYIMQYNKNMIAQGLYFSPLPALYMFARGDDFDEVRMYERYDPGSKSYTQFWPHGTGVAEMQNPYWVMNNMLNETHKRRYMFSANLNYQILDWLSVSGRAKVDNSTFDITEKRDAGTAKTWASKFGYFGQTKQENRQFYGDALLNIDKTLGDFHIGANIGASIKDTRMDGMAWKGGLRSYPNEFTISNIEQNNYKDFQSGSHTQMQSVFASAEFSWRNMLYLTVTGRNDWASELAFSSQSSFFYPSVGLSAVVSEMVKMPEWFTFLKVRGSYSQVGSPFPAYKTRPYLDYSDQTHSWTSLEWRPMSNLKPEMTDSWEIGVNARFFSGKLNLDLTYYSADTRNQTFTVPISASSGYSSGLIQGGIVRNSGIEMLLGYNNKWRDFIWSTSYTFTYNYNEIKKLTNGLIVDGKPIEQDFLPMAMLGDSGSPQVFLYEGGGMADIYISKRLATDMNGNIWVDPQTGDVKMVEIEREKVGSLLPKYNMGWNNTFSYKGIDLNVLFSARIGGNVVSNTEAFLDTHGVSERSAQARENGGIDINGFKVDAQKFYQTIGAGSGQGGYYVYSATNVRLQELSLGYTLPQKWFHDKMKMTVSLVGRNLWMIYNKAPFDPELAPSTTSSYYAGVDMFMHPSLRNIGFSVKFQF